MMTLKPLLAAAAALATLASFSAAHAKDVLGVACTNPPPAH
jgi:hypothetical protein